MTDTAHPPVKLFQFPRLFAVPNLSPFCCKLETWLRIARVPYEVVDTPDPRKAPKGKLPFIEDGGVRIADTSIIVDHLKKTRGVDPDAGLDASQRALALLVQRTLEEHYAFILAYTHLVRDEGLRHTNVRFDAVPAVMRPLVAGMVRSRVKKLLWHQGILRHSERDIFESALRDWRAVLAVMGHRPFFFGGCFVAPGARRLVTPESTKPLVGWIQRSNRTLSDLIAKPIIWPLRNRVVQ
jgi:glutathione S-transferase